MFKLVNPFSKFARYLEKQESKRQAIDPTTGAIKPSQLSLLLKRLGGSQVLFVKKDFLGRPYVSRNPSDRLLGGSGHPQEPRKLTGHSVPATLIATHGSTVQKPVQALSPAVTHPAAAASTGALRDANRSLAQVQPPQAQAADEAIRIGTEIEQTFQQWEASERADEMAQQFDQDSTRLIAELDKIGDLTVDEQTGHADASGFLDAKALDNFQLQLRQEKIQRPSYDQVTAYVEELNSIEQAHINRLPERSQVTDLLEFIRTGRPLKPTDALGLKTRPINTFEEKTFATPYEAAHFLFLETNFFENLNASDSEYFKAAYLQQATREAALRAAETPADDAAQGTEHVY